MITKTSSSKPKKLKLTKTKILHLPPKNNPLPKANPSQKSPSLISPTFPTTTN
jgi:hypothetical protein